MFLTDKNIIVLKEVDSTNNYAKQLIADKAEEGTVVLAHYQKEGKGQQGNYWESEPGENLLFSMVLYPNFLAAGSQFYISKIVCLALLQMLNNKVEGVTIKWPNDIYIGKKKIAGILIENSIKGMSIDSSIIGIGLNLNQEQFKSDAPNPVSLKQLLGKHFDLQVVLSEFVEEFSLYLEKLKQGDIESIDEAYFSSLFGHDEWSLYRKKEKIFEGRIVGVGDFGQLKIEEKSGDISEFMFKEVEFVL